MSKNPWLEELHGRKGKTIQSRSLPKPKITDLKRIIEKTPEVMFKVSRSQQTSVNGVTIFPSPRNGTALQALAEYISRSGLEEMTDELGLTYTGPDAVKEATWGWNMPESSNRREALHIIMGMPKETKDGGRTDIAALERAVVQTAESIFKDHRFLIAHHQDSESGNPHSHLIVKIDSNNGCKRLDPRKADLRRYRETFAEKLRDNGIEANATSKVARLSTRRSLGQANYQYIKKNNPQSMPEQMIGRITDAHLSQLSEYLKLSSVLSKSSDKTHQEFSDKLKQFISDTTGIPKEHVMKNDQREAEKQQDDQEHQPTM